MSEWRTEIERLASRDGAAYRDLQIAFCEEWVRKCESPIEQIMAAHLVNWACWADYSRLFAKVDICDTPELVTKRGRITTPAPGHAYIAAQQPIGSYRVDFMVVARHGDRTVGVVIECDGHDFHERTKDQAKRDRSRDRALTLKGFHVLRFTGSELTAAPERCFGDFKELIEANLFGLPRGGEMLAAAE